jgi:hypothetical protein
VEDEGARHREVGSVTTTIQAIRDELVADATVTNLVAQRIYAQIMPQGVVLPAVLLTVISETPENSVDGSPSSRLVSSLVQADTYAKGYADARALADAVVNVLGGLSRPDLSGELQTTRDSYDDETQLHRVSVDVLIWR